MVACSPQQETLIALLFVTDGENLGFAWVKFQLIHWHCVSKWYLRITEDGEEWTKSG